MSVVRTPVDAHCDWSKKPPSIRVIEINRVRRYTRTDVKKKNVKIIGFPAKTPVPPSSFSRENERRDSVCRCRVFVLGDRRTHTILLPLPSSVGWWLGGYVSVPGSIFKHNSPRRICPGRRVFGSDGFVKCLPEIKKSIVHVVCK